MATAASCSRFSAAVASGGSSPCLPMPSAPATPYSTSWRGDTQGTNVPQCTPQCHSTTCNSGERWHGSMGVRCFVRARTLRSRRDSKRLRRSHRCRASSLGRSVTLWTRRRSWTLCAAREHHKRKRAAASETHDAHHMYITTATGHCPTATWPHSRSQRAQPRSHGGRQQLTGLGVALAARAVEAPNGRPGLGPRRCLHHVAQDVVDAVLAQQRLHGGAATAVE